MKHIKDKNQIEEYYNQFPLSDYFGFDIQPYITVVQFEPGDLILKEGDEPEFLYYLVDGRAKLFLSHDNGRISLINFLSAPCFIGEMELIEAQVTSNGVKAITACTCFAVRITSCKEKLLNDTTFLRYLCVLLGKKAIGNSYNYSRNQSYALDVRLATFILLTATNGYYRERHTEVAEFLGVTYRHLLYVLACFVKTGMLEKTPQGYHIVDVKKLKRIADENK
ncbi:Regulatory protein YeiL [bioreactor metagenome]|uniref:Regulatory protein YeiL n=1 Tax=bioreactor metagenome TaxID=1076179 RepID=A0A644WSF7_9ZZZZ|nr:transcriptional regulator YeiL [Sedimentibacter saalensis]MEA5095030.1 transcriptional regulator YeiL [Sedimentibacter saalensis]